jgi:hypothetical protein
MWQSLRHLMESFRCLFLHLLRMFMLPSFCSRVGAYARKGVSSTTPSEGFGNGCCRLNCHRQVPREFTSASRLGLEQQQAAIDGSSPVPRA